MDKRLSNKEPAEKRPQDIRRSRSDSRANDVDSHVAEPPDLWVSRGSSKWGDDIPHVATDPKTGIDGWVIRDTKVANVAQQAMPGWDGPARPPPLEQADPSTWQPKPRLKWMDENGIYSQVIYPNILGLIPAVFLELDPNCGSSVCGRTTIFRPSFARKTRIHPPNCLLTMVGHRGKQSRIASLCRFAAQGRAIRVGISSALDSLHCGPPIGSLFSG